MNKKTSKTNEKLPHFHKYVTAETAVAILKSGTFQFSAASKFNDPFDMQFDPNTDLPFTKSEFIDAMSHKLECMQKTIRSKSPMKEFNRISKVLVKEMLSHGNLSRQEISDLYKSNFENWYETEIINKMPLHYKGINKVFGNYCFFCVSETPNNDLMWAHYTEGHKGAVIRLKPLAESAGIVNKLGKIKYKKNLPQYGALEGFVNTLPYDEKYSPAKFVEKFTRTKTSKWVYEREWRTGAELKDGKEKETGFAYHPFFPEEIDEIVFGYNMSDDYKKKLVLKINEKYPDTTIKVAVKNATKPELDYVLYEDRIRGASSTQLYSKNYEQIKWSSS